MLYATAEGGLGQLFLDAETVRRGWRFAAPGASSAVEALDSSIDMTEDGVQVQCYPHIPPNRDEPDPGSKVF